MSVSHYDGGRGQGGTDGEWEGGTSFKLCFCMCVFVCVRSCSYLEWKKSNVYSGNISDAEGFEFGSLTCVCLTSPVLSSYGDGDHHSSIFTWLELLTHFCDLCRMRLRLPSLTTYWVHMLFWWERISLKFMLKPLRWQNMQKILATWIFFFVCQ